MRIARSLPAALAVAMLCSTFVAPPATAADTGPVKIAVITDMSGVYAALAGQGAVEATKMAVEDFGGKVLGRPIEVDSRSTIATTGPTRPSRRARRTTAAPIWRST